MFNKITIITLSLTLSFSNSFLNAQDSKKKIPQEGLVSNYGPIQNIWRLYNYTTGHNRKNDILEAIKNNDKESFKKNFMEGDLVNQTDIVVEIILNNKLELLQMLDEEQNLDIKAIIERHESRQNNVNEIPHALVKRHGPNALDMLRFLKNRGIEIDLKNNEGNTIAHTINDKLLFDEFVGKTVAVNTRNNQGETPVFIATKTNDLPKLKLLVTAQPDVNIPNNEGLFPGHIAASGQCSAACAKIIFESPTLDHKAVNHEGVSIKKTLSKTHHRECIKGLGKITDKKTLSDYKKRCNHITAIEHYFKQGYLKGLDQRIKALKEEKNHLIDLKASLSQQELEKRKLILEEQLANLELEKQQYEEVRKNEKAELSEIEEFAELLDQEIANQEQTSAQEVTKEDNKEKNPDDSH